jgi:hypothetical protein
MMEHQHERVALEAHHREEEERRHQGLAAMQPGCPWHGIPPPLQLNQDWQVRRTNSCCVWLIGR